MILKELKQMQRAACERVFRPVAHVDFVEWCKRNIVLRPDEAPEAAGPYRTDKCLAMAKLFELALDGGENWRSLSIAKGAQSTATLHALAAIVRHVATSQGNVIYVIHSQEEAANISRRLKNLLEDCTETAKILEEVEGDDKTIRAIRLPNCTIWITGAGSAGALASKPGVKLMVSDEVDKHNRLKGEAETLDLIEQRGKTLESAFAINFSTPTVEDNQIWRAYQRGTRHRYFVPCPFCDHMQTLELDRLRFSDCQDLLGEFDLERVKAQARLECEECAALIGSEHKRAMIEAGEWRPTNFKLVEQVLEDGTKQQNSVANWVPGRMSAQISDLHYFWPSSSFGELAVKKIEASKDPLKLHDFLNNYAGQPFKLGGSRSVEESDVLSLRGAYKRGEMPIKPELVTFAADTQDDTWKWVLCGWNARGDCWVVDYGQTMAWRDVMEIAKRGAKFEGDYYRAKFCLVDDGGHRSYEVRGNVVGLRPWFFACRGQAGKQINHHLAWRNFNLTKNGAETIPVLNFDDPTFKRLLYRERILRSKTRDDLASLKLHLPSDIDGQFVRELCGERYNRVSDPVTGAAAWRWVSSPPNDFGDALKMNYIAHEVVKGVMGGTGAGEVV